MCNFSSLIKVGNGNYIEFWKLVVKFNPIPNLLGHPVEKVFFRYFSCALRRSCTACHNALIGLNHSVQCSEGKATNLLHLSYVSAWTTQLVIIITSIPTAEKHNGLIRLMKSIDKKSLWHEKVAKMLRLQ